jgi:hypothetical protein
LVTRTGGFSSGGSSGKVCPSDGESGSIKAPVDPVALKRPANGAAIPPKLSHGEPFCSASRDWVACSGVTGVGPLPPSMKTRPSSRRRRPSPSKSQVAYAVVIEPPRE